jgi:hypothetical protein
VKERKRNYHQVWTERIQHNPLKRWFVCSLAEKGKERKKEREIASKSMTYASHKKGVMLWVSK